MMEIRDAKKNLTGATSTTSLVLNAHALGSNRLNKEDWKIDVIFLFCEAGFHEDSDRGCDQGDGDTDYNLSQHLHLLRLVRGHLACSQGKQIGRMLTTDRNRQITGAHNIGQTAEPQDT
ncbi:hypothetical protein LCL97_24190 [Seohaeicola saemankumensis]|nr:hypothetical protein [Seohaeicola saemankumensis]MCA0873937.1 hypothetical protein [Seohaeicola saemankumensis]